MYKLFSNPIIIVAITVISLTFLFSLRKNANKTKLSATSLNKLEQEVKNLDKNIEDAEEDLKIAQHPHTKEKIIRNELLMQKEGEYIVQISLPDNNKNQTIETIKQSPWEKWWLLLNN